MVIVVRGQVWSNPSIFLLWPSRWNNGVWNCDLELMCLCCNGSKIHSQLVTRKVRACHGWEKRWLLGSIARLCIEQHSDQLTIFRLKKKMSDTIVTSLKLLINRLCSDSTVAKFVAKSRKGPFSWSFITRWCMKKKCWMIFRRLEPQSTSILRVITGSPNCVVCCPFESNQTHFGYTNIMDSKCIDSES